MNVLTVLHTYACSWVSCWSTISLSTSARMFANMRIVKSMLYASWISAAVWIHNMIETPIEQSHYDRSYLDVTVQHECEICGLDGIDAVFRCDHIDHMPHGQHRRAL